MKENVVSIVVDEENKQTVLNTYYEWRRSTGDKIISLPPESVGQFDKRGLEQGKILNNVPREFLKVLKEKGIAYSYI